MLLMVGESMLHEMYLLGPNTIWTKAEIMEMISSLEFIPKQHTTLEAGIRLERGVDNLRHCLGSKNKQISAQGSKPTTPPTGRVSGKYKIPKKQKELGPQGGA